MDYQWHDFIGNIGVAFIIITYLLVQLGRMGSASYSYSILNALGAFFVIISLMYEFNMSVFIIDVVWIGVSVFGIIRQWRVKR